MKIFSTLSAVVLISCSVIIATHSSAQDEGRSGFIAAAVPLKRAAPVYPKSELSGYNSGMAEVELAIGKDGIAFDPVILRSPS